MGGAFRENFDAIQIVGTNYQVGGKCELIHWPYARHLVWCGARYLCPMRHNINT